MDSQVESMRDTKRDTKLETMRMTARARDTKNSTFYTQNEDDEDEPRNYRRRVSNVSFVNSAIAENNAPFKSPEPKLPDLEDKKRNLL